jgi:HD-GYP domain-containing protein (c-di-GMP phosphodiesterase class II)
MLNEQQKLDTLMVLGIEVNRIHDLDILLERLLTRARQFVNADAGTIYIREGDRLNFAHSQNAALQKQLHAGQKLIYANYSLPIDHTSIAGYAAATGKMLSIPDVYKRDELRMGAMLHDVGKVAISDLILKKPTQLNGDEYEIMKQHTAPSNTGIQIVIPRRMNKEGGAYKTVNAE